MKQTQESITAEIAKLKEMKPRVRAKTAFGDDNHRAIETQIRVLSERMTSDEADEKYGEAVDHIRDNAMEAAHWLDGESSDGSPSENWAPLTN